MTVTISQFSENQFFACVETRNGHRYMASYYIKPTEDEVKEDFRENKASFTHIN